MRIFDADVTGSLHVSGSSELKGNLVVSGSETITGSLTVHGNTKLGDQLTDTHTVTGSLLVTGSISGSLTGALRTDYIDFNTGSTIAGAVGRMTWNDTDGTVDLGLKGGNVTLQIGQEQLVRVVNGTGGNLLESNYHVVRVNGAQGNRLKVALAQANNDDNSAETLGLVTENINNGSEGFVTVGGLVRQINTTGALFGELWNDGDTLYLSPTNAGHPTNIKPEAPNHMVIVGYVVRAHATQGAIFVKVNNGYEIDELHNVKINTGSLSYGDLLMRSGSIWTNSKNLSGSYQLTGSLDISGSQTINGNQIVSGSLTITNNITVLGTSSFVYVTSSNLNLTGPYIYTNVFEPIERFGGLVVFDSGSLSHQATASLLWDSLNNHWIYQNASGSSYSGGMLLSGPRNSGSLGNEVGLTSTRIPKSVGGDHLDNSNIYDDGSKVKIISNTEITGSLKVTGGISGSIDYSYIQNAPSLVSGSAQINITGTTGYSSVSSSIATALEGSWRASDGITTDAISFNETVIIQGGANTNVTFLPGVNTFTINSSHQSVSAASSSNNSGRTYIQDILLDSFGHITGITTATETVVNTDLYTTGVTFNTGDGVLTFNRNDGNTYTVDLDGRYGTSSTDYYVTGGTFNTGTGNLRLTRNDGNTIDVGLDGRFLTAHPSVSAASSSDNSGRTYIQDILLDSFGHITGITTATETVVDTYTTGVTTNGTTGLITFTKNDGGTYTTSISGYVTTQIANLIDSAPTTLDTLNELAAALGDDPNFATSIATSIGNKVSKSGDTMTGNLSIFKNNTTLTLGQINVSTGFTTIEMYAGGGGAFNGYSIRYNKDTSFDRLEFVDGGGIATVYFENGGFVNANRFIKIGGTSSQFLKADGSVDSSTYLTAHPSVSAASSSNNSGRTYIQDILLDSFGHITGITTATETVTDTNTFITGATFNTGDGVVTITKNDGNTVTVDLDGRYQLSGSYLTGYTETDTLATVTARGNTTNQAITVSGVTSYNDVVISGGTLTVYESVSGATVFAVDGTNGRLFAVTDDLSNSLFSVNTISGLPVIEAFADYHIVMGRFNQNDFYLGTTGEIGMGSLPVTGYKLAVTGNVRATSFVKSGGTSSQFLKADGSVDSSTYLTAHPSVSAASSSNNSGRTYIQDILLDSFGHITGITTATETVVDTNNYTTGVTFNTGDGVLTFTRNDGNTYTVDLDGRYGTSSTDYYTTGATFNTGNGVITYTRNDGGTYTVDIDGRFLTSYSETSTLEDVTQRGNTTTISITAASFITQGGNSGQFVKGDGSLDSNTYLTAHPSVSAASSSNNSGRTYIQDILLDSFGHITGITTASETVTDTNYYVTGATFNTGNGVITLTRNDGNTITVDIDGKYLDSSSYTASDVLSKLLTVDGASSGLDADLLDGQHGSYYYPASNPSGYISSYVNYYVTGATFNTGNGVITMTRNDGGTVTVDIDGKYSELGHTHDDRYLPYVKNVETSGLVSGRWYTIAVNVGNRAVGKFILRDTSSGNHQSVVFYATHHYGNYSDITVLINSRYGGNPFRYLRIVDGTTYDGALLQVYIDQDNSTVQAWMLENIQASGWVIKDWVDEAVDPGDVANFPALTTTPAQVDLDQAPQGGMIVTGPIYGGGDTTQYEYLNTNNYSTTTDTRYYTETEIANFFSGASSITGYNKSNWDTAYGWGNHSTQGYATTGYVQTQISNLIDSAPGTLDTLNELAAAINDDPNFYATITGITNNKVSKSGDTMTGNLSFGATSNLGLTWGLNTDAAFIKFISTSNSAGGSYLEIGTQDDSDEEIKFTQSGNVRFYLATDGFLRSGGGYKYLYENGTWAIDISGNAATVTNGVYTNGSYSNPSWITALAGSKITGNISGNASNITSYTINQDLGTSNSPTFNNVTATGVYGTNSSSTRNKYNVYSNSGTYAIGMESGANFGGLADWAMTFQMNNDDDRGFWWGDDAHSTSQGAMALTTNGYLTVARGVRVGYGESDTTTPNVPLQVYGSGSLVFDVQGSQGQLFSVTDSLSGSLYSVNDISGLPILEVFSDDRLVAGSYGTNAFVVSGTTTTVSGSLAVSGSATVNGGTVWHSNNDGSGSGLDADTLDGYHASSFLTGHPSVSAASSVNNSGRTYIQDILLDGFGHITGITSATETVTDTNDFISDVNFDGTNLTFTGSGGAFSGPVDISSVNTDTNYYTTSASFNTSNGIITFSRNDGGTYTVDIDGKYAEASHTHNYVAINGTDRVCVLRFYGEGGNSGFATGDYPYGIFQEGGVWSSPYPDLKINFHTGIVLAAAASYGGVRFQRDYNDTTELMSVGNGDAHVRVANNLYMGGNLVATQSWVGSQGYLTAHPSVSASSSSNNSGRTYIQDILLDSFGHITGITTGTETVVDTDTNYYTTSASFNTSNGIITFSRNDGGTYTVDIDGKYQEAGTYLGAIDYNNNSNANYQLLWGSGNAVYGTGDVYVNPYTDYVYAASFNASDWFRSSGASGWYNSTYGGGIYQTESTMVKVYDNRGFYIDGGNTNTGSDGTLYVTATNNNDWLGIFNAYNGSKTEYGVYVRIAAGASYGYALMTDGSTWTYRVDGSGRVYAPIYYDINDTNYYVNPASTSNLGIVKLNSTASGTEVFTVDGVNGRLFTITDDLSNSLFSVNTIAGVPVIEAFADNKVIMGRYNQNDFYIATTGEIGMGNTSVSGYKLAVTGNVRATSFVKSGGSSSQFLMADGSVSTNPGWITTHPTISAASSVNNSGRTYIQDITLDSNGHVTGIVSATETVVDTDTNYYLNSASFNTGNGVLTLGVTGYGNVTVDLDGRYLESYTETDTFATVTARGNISNGAVTINGALTVGQGTTSDIYMTDTDETTRRIHCNSGRVGFLNSSSNWGAYNDNTGNWITPFAMYASDWFRSYGTTGWYSETYAGGIYMADSTWVRVYNNKQFLVENLIQSNTAMYAPIFYDSANNGYYLNPNGYSNLGTVRFNSSGAGAEVIAADGVNGRLFTITDDMTDSIFSVNTISGLPVIEAFADYKVVMGRYGQNDFHLDTNGNIAMGATPVSGVKLFVSGKLSIGGSNSSYDLYNNGTTYLNGAVTVDDNLTMNGSIIITNSDIRSNATSNWTGDPGSQGKIQYHSNRWYIVSDSSSNRIVQFRRDSVDVSYIDNNGVFQGTASYASSAGNADTVDSLHASDFVRAYTTSAGDIDADWGQSFKTFDPVPSGTPPLASPNIRTINIGENFARRTQLAFDYASDLAYFRRRNDSGWQTWREFIHSGNIGSFALTSLPSHNHDDRYFTETESDARFQPLENQRVSTGNLPTFAGVKGSSYFDAQASSGFRIRNSNDTANTGAFTRRGLWEGNSNYDPAIWAETGYSIYIYTNGSATIRAYWDTSGHLLPGQNNTYDLGSSSLGWRNIYTNDLHLSNMNKPEGNDIDGTSGTWTIQEGAENLYIINNLNGKKYRIKLEEI